MMDMQVDVGKQKVVVVIADRKDYYHQLFVTPARFSTNAVGPAVHEMLAQGHLSLFCLPPLTVHGKAGKT